MMREAGRLVLSRGLSTTVPVGELMRSLLPAVLAVGALLLSTSVNAVPFVRPSLICIDTGCAPSACELAPDCAPDPGGPPGNGVIGEGSCAWWQRWGVQMEFRGQGAVTAEAKCGGEIVASCGATSPTQACNSGIQGSGTGDLDCVATIVAGTVKEEDVTGQCYDPYVPDRVMPLVVIVQDAVLGRGDQ